MLIFQLKTGRLSIVAGRGLCVISKGGARGEEGVSWAPTIWLFTDHCQRGDRRAGEGGAGVKLGEILPWVTMGGGRGEEGQVGWAYNDQDSAILVPVIFGGASNY